jgi:hypothetical protein
MKHESNNDCPIDVRPGRGGRYKGKRQVAPDYADAQRRQRRHRQTFRQPREGAHPLSLCSLNGPSMGPLWALNVPSMFNERSLNAP